MLTKEDSIKLALQKFHEIEKPEFPFALIESETITKPYGWVYFYNSSKFLETGEYRYSLAGNGPVIVNKFTSEIVLYGSAKDPDEYIREYEKKLPSNQLL